MVCSNLSPILQDNWQQQKSFFTRNKSGSSLHNKECPGCGVSRSDMSKWYTDLRRGKERVRGSRCRACEFKRRFTGKEPRSTLNKRVHERRNGHAAIQYSNDVMFRCLLVCWCRSLFVFPWAETGTLTYQQSLVHVYGGISHQRVSSLCVSDSELSAETKNILQMLWSLAGAWVWLTSQDWSISLKLLLCRQVFFSVGGFAAIHSINE